MKAVEFVRRVWEEQNRERGGLSKGEKSKEWAFYKERWASDPKIRCPYCEEWIETKRFWLWRGGRLLGEWDLGTGRRVRVHVHPHVNEGRICLGDVEDAGEALFAGLDPGSCYFEIGPWLQKEFGHQCSREKDWDLRECWRCEELVAEEDGRFSGDQEEFYCTSCYNDLHAYCYRCEEDWYHGGDYDGGEVIIGWKFGRIETEIWCPDCIERRTYECKECSELICKRWTSEREDFCPKCWDYIKEECFSCKKGFLEEELEYGKCVNCLDEVVEDEIEQKEEEGDE